MKVTAIITAAGSGTRFSKSGKPKQYLIINGKPIILYSLLAFQQSKLVNEIIVSASKDYFSFLHELSLKNNVTKLTKLVEGGKTRFESVKNAIIQIEPPSAGDIVVIHDAVRPNIDIYFINMLIEGIGRFDGIIPGLKIQETVKRVKNGIVSETLNREDIYTVQTPQVFKYKSLSMAYKKCREKNDFTDESALVEYGGYRVKITDGRKDNIKITKQDDLLILKTLWFKSDSLKFPSGIIRRR